MKFPAPTSTSMRSVAGYSLIQREHVVPPYRMPRPVGPEVEVWHAESDRLMFRAPNWRTAIAWAETNAAH